MSFPTQLTVLRIVLVPVFYFLFAVMEPAQLTWAAGVFFVAAASDWWDGYMARLLNSTTPLGAFLDPLADKMLTSGAFIAFAAKDILPWWMVILIISRDLYLTGFRIAADKVGRTVKTSNFAKAKTFLQMTFIGAFLLALIAAQGSLGVGLISVGKLLSSPDIVYDLMLLVTFVTVASAAQYTYDNWATLMAFTSRFILRRSPQNF